MPEGPEVWILSKAINKYYSSNKSRSYGKHIFLHDISENWSFGLLGNVNINPTDNSLMKINTGWIYGDKEKYENFEEEIKKLGIDYMTADENLIKKEVDTWRDSKQKLAKLILDQSKISGIGVAWGSEILYRVGLKPNIKACEQDLSELANSMIYFRDKLRFIYQIALENSCCGKFINDWFENLYRIREMKIYKKGSKIEVSGRNWWV